VRPKPLNRDDTPQRLAKYIVISKPKRTSIAAGVSHFIAVVLQIRSHESDGLLYTGGSNFEHPSNRRQKHCTDSGVQVTFVGTYFPLFRRSCGRICWIRCQGFSAFHTFRQFL